MAIDRRRAAAWAGTLAAVMGLASPTLAWKCARVLDTSDSPSGPALFWSDRTVHYAFNSAGTTALDNDTAQDTVRAAFAVWQDGTPRADQPAGCPTTAVAGVAKATDVAFVEDPATDQNFVGYNYLNPTVNRNVILFRDTSWPHPLTETTSDLVSLTTVTYNAITGEILDADIEVNTADFTLTTGDTDVAYDLLSALVHEVGHFLGFDHSDEAAAAMNSSLNRGDTIKRGLHCDDAAILWFRYPAGDVTRTCRSGVVNATCGMCAPPGMLAFDANIRVRDTYNGHSGCTCQSTQGGQALLATLLALGARAWRRRTRAQA